MNNEIHKESLISQRIFKSIVEERGQIIKEPCLYQVMMLNDDFTPMEFVVIVLERFFNTDRERATQIMLEAHMTGKALCGAYTKDVAASKILQVANYAEKNEHPLNCSMEVGQ